MDNGNLEQSKALSRQVVCFNRWRGEHECKCNLMQNRSYTKQVEGQCSQSMISQCKVCK